MNAKEARERLNAFMGDHKILTFCVTDYPTKEWSAECNEIPAIVTCGIDEPDHQRIEKMQDAIITAAGISKDYSNILKLSGYNANLDKLINPTASYYVLQSEGSLQIS